MGQRQEWGREGQMRIDLIGICWEYAAGDMLLPNFQLPSICKNDECFPLRHVTPKSALMCINKDFFLSRTPLPPSYDESQV